MKKILLFLRLSFCLITANAQSTAYFKAANTGTLTKIEKVSTGGYITLGTDSNYKLQVIRWDNNFNALWYYKFPDPNIFALNPQVIESNDGSFFMMVKSYAQGGCSFITKFSSSGTMLWQKEYYVSGGASSGYALSRAGGSDNGFLFGGGGNVISNFIIKCDQDGNILWQNQYYYPLASGIITAWSILTEGTDYVVSSGYNTNSLLTFRIDASGAILSHTAYTYSSMQIIPTRMVKLNSTNGYAILGNYNNSNNNQTQFLAILDNSLSLTSFNELTISGYDQFELHDIAAINNGQNLILDGSIYDNSVFYIATMNVSNTGTIVWKSLGSGNSGMPDLNVEFRGVTSLGNNTMHVGYGFYEGAVVSIIDSTGNGLCNTLPFNVTNVSRTLALQSSTLISISANAIAAPAAYVYNTNVYSTQYFYCGSLPTSVEQPENEFTEIEIYPSPATDAFTISSRVPGVRFMISEIEIYNLLGEKRLTLNPSRRGEGLRVDVSSFAPGVYFVRLANEKEQIVKKVIIQR